VLKINLNVIVPETSLLVLFGCGLDWVVGPNFSFVMGWVRLGQTVGGLDCTGSKKMDLHVRITLLSSEVFCLWLQFMFSFFSNRSSIAGTGRQTFMRSVDDLLFYPLSLVLVNQTI